MLAKGLFIIPEDRVDEPGKKPEFRPIKLLRNVSYPTFQLYAEVENTKTGAPDALKIAVAETFTWLRTRFRGFDEIPPEMCLPEPRDYLSIRDDDLRSFRINEGYVAEVAYVRDKGIWAFNLIEPDLGPDPGNPAQARKPVPGRVFETNIAFRITDARLECGFKTTCSEPEGTALSCESFRISVVKAMVRNELLGLKQGLPIAETPYEADTVEKVKRIAAFAKDEQREIPLVLVSEYIGAVDMLAFFKTLQTDIGSLRPQLERIAEEYNTTAAAELPKKFNELTKLCMGYAHFCVLPNRFIGLFAEKTKDEFPLENGDAQIIFPVQSEQSSRLFTRAEISGDQSDFFNTVRKIVTGYAKGKVMRFGRVKFINDARAEEQQTIVDMNASKTDIAEAYRKELEIQDAKHIEEINALRAQLKAREERIARLLEQIDEKEARNKVCLDKISDYESLHIELDRCRRRESDIRAMLIERPNKPDEMAKWVEKYFPDRLILHNNAIGLMKKVKPGEVDMALLCDAIEFLAVEYLECLLRLITPEEKETVCSEKYGRGFEVTAINDRSIETFPGEYKIKYGRSYKGNPVEAPLNLHLKIGVDPEHLIRIYFLYDAEKRLIVIGSMPKHLSTGTEN